MDGKVLGEIGGRAYAAADLDPGLLFVDRLHGEVEVGRDLPERLEELERATASRSSCATRLGSTARSWITCS